MSDDPLSFWPNHGTSEVIITRERRKHYLLRHSEVEGHELLLIRSLLDPSEIHFNKSDRQMAIIYQQMDDEHFLRVPLWISDRIDRQNSVLSVRIAKSEEVRAGRKSGRVAWVKR